MRQIIYFSTSSSRQDAIVIAGILAASRNRNRLEHVTGLLVAGGHRYLQVIEGPANTIGATIDRIKRDARHLGVTVLLDRLVGGRNFRGWSMAFQEEPRLDEFATFQQLVDQLHGQIPDEKLRQQIDCFARDFAVVPMLPVSSILLPAALDAAALAVERAH